MNLCSLVTYLRTSYSLDCFFVATYGQVILSSTHFPYNNIPSRCKTFNLAIFQILGYLKKTINFFELCARLLALDFALPSQLHSLLFWLHTALLRHPAIFALVSLAFRPTLYYPSVMPALTKRIHELERGIDHTAICVALWAIVYRV